MNQEQRTKKAEQLRIAARIIETGCEWEYLADGDSKSGWATHWMDVMKAVCDGDEIRIKELVIQVPEGWRELRDDEKDGRWIIGAKFLDGNDWLKYGTSKPGCFAVKEGRIIVPVAKPKKRVPLGPEDIPPGTCIKPSDEYVGWGMICEVDSSGVHLGEDRHLSFNNLMNNNWSINRPADTEWQGCWKLEVES